MVPWCFHRKRFLKDDWSFPLKGREAYSLVDLTVKLTFVKNCVFYFNEF